jgi:hypothetical protein
VWRDQERLTAQAKWKVKSLWEWDPLNEPARRALIGPAMETLPFWRGSVVIPPNFLHNLDHRAKAVKGFSVKMPDA